MSHDTNIRASQRRDSVTQTALIAAYHIDSRVCGSSLHTTMYSMDVQLDRWMRVEIRHSSPITQARWLMQG